MQRHRQPNTPRPKFWRSELCFYYDRLPHLKPRGLWGLQRQLRWRRGDHPKGFLDEPLPLPASRVR